MRLSEILLGLTLVAGSAGLAMAQNGQNGMTDAQIRQSLEAQGYSNVRITEHGKSHVDATAMKDGKQAKLAVNPQTGQASPDNDKDD